MPPQVKGETAADALKKILADLAQASILPDADTQFLSQIQQMIVEHLRAQGGGQAPGTMGQPGGLGPAAGPLPGAVPPIGGPAPGGAMPGMSPMGPQGSMPSGDELARVLAQAGGGK